MEGREESESDSGRRVSGLRVLEVLPKGPSTVGVTVPAA